MATSWFSTKVNLSTIVSQGLEHVTKLKDDVEKQFDEAVSGKGTTKLPLVPSTSSAAVEQQPLPPSLFQESVSSTATPLVDLAPSPAPSQSGESPPPPASEHINHEAEQTSEDEVLPGHNDAPVPHASGASNELQTTDSTRPSMSSEGADTSPILCILAPSTIDQSSEPASQLLLLESNSPQESSLLLAPSPSSLPSHTDDATASDASGWHTSLDEMQPDAAENAALLAIVQAIPPNPVNTSEATSTTVQPPSHVGFDVPPLDSATTTAAPSVESSSSCDNAIPPTQSSVAEKVALPLEASLFLQKELAHVQSELRKTQTVLSERENQLMSSSTAMSKLNEELESMRNHVSPTPATTTNDAAVIYALQVALADKEMQLSNLLEEGEALSKKQAAFESRLRALRKEKTDVMDENKKLTAALETATAKWETARMHLVTAEEDAKLHAQLLKSLDATDAQLQASEATLAATKQRLATAECHVEELVAENDALKARTQLEAVQDREALEATIAELQASVTRVEAEASAREDQARLALHAMKQRWQEAVTRMDHLTHTTSDATQPLLRQLQLVQEEQRVQELRRISFETDMQKRVDTAARDVAALQAQLAKETSRARDATTQASALAEQVKALLANLDAEKRTVETLRQQLETDGHRRQQLEQQLEALSDENRQIATRLRLEQDQHELQVTQLHQQDTQRAQEVTTLRQQLCDVVSNSRVRRPSGGSSSILPTSPLLDVPSPAFQPDPQHTTTTSIGHLERKPSGDVIEDMSMIEWNQLLQKVRLRESETALLKHQLHTVEDARKSASDDVVRLSTRNAALEAAAADLAVTKAALAAMEVKQHVLLELLGEKDEQVEELESEFREFKQMYQNQIDTLTRR
ncbi:hypothetical protein DYB26_000815 [Aphanomyces astaci]|uniref:TATA element modulatory factor 1 TATA binding domain-containing protein n=2 Tax=Aphanomyces astaci TaxID=112090 RepID=A0A418FKV4_APHAT|nr:hypothetical protein DYB26_000815 [Aphanomyces astaci]